uniref:Uncharacterized protein n=1 Tax=Rhizophora mucronata TaxID=61149 RepID=A0A2P2QA28_RHIMU
MARCMHMNYNSTVGIMETKLF